MSFTNVPEERADEIVARLARAIDETHEGEPPK